jgi:hypothetical protein
MVRQNRRDEVAAVFHDFLDLEMRGWKGRAGTAMAQEPGMQRFAGQAIGALAGRGAVRAARLSCGSRPIACILTLVSANAAAGVGKSPTTKPSPPIRPASRHSSTSPPRSWRRTASP